jgi:hypothetical protein
VGDVSEEAILVKGIQNGEKKRFRICCPTNKGRYHTDSDYVYCVLCAVSCYRVGVAIYIQEAITPDLAG